MLVTLNMLRAVAPHNPNLDQWVTPINNALNKYNISTKKQVAAFLAHASHESGGFMRLTENLNYSAERLCQVWPKRFPSLSVANAYAHNPEALANKVYANRMGNGDEHSGDGWKYRGRGLFQLTGKENYSRFGYTTNADFVGTPEGAALSAAWFFNDKHIGYLADNKSVKDQTLAINGGLNGLDERTNLFNAALKVMG